MSRLMARAVYSYNRKAREFRDPIPNSSRLPSSQASKTDTKLCAVFEMPVIDDLYRNGQVAHNGLMVAMYTVLARDELMSAD